jgi:hypothetical protein
VNSCCNGSCPQNNCSCYAPSNIREFKENEVLQKLWNVRSMWDTDSIKTKRYSLECLDVAIAILIARGRL